MGRKHKGARKIPLGRNFFIKIIPGRSTAQLLNGHSTILQVSSAKGKDQAQLPTGWSGKMEWIGKEEVLCKVNLTTPNRQKIRTTITKTSYDEQNRGYF